jgi:hypothetical protein
MFFDVVACFGKKNQYLALLLTVSTFCKHFGKPSDNNLGQFFTFFSKLTSISMDLHFRHILNKPKIMSDIKMWSSVK